MKKRILVSVAIALPIVLLAIGAWRGFHTSHPMSMLAGTVLALFFAVQVSVCLYKRSRGKTAQIYVVKMEPDDDFASTFDWLLMGAAVVLLAVAAFAPVR